MKFAAAILISLVLIWPVVPSAAFGGETRENPTAQQEGKKPRPQTPPEPDVDDEQAIKLGAQLVTVPFNVTDKKNRYINDLQKTDVELLEDNKLQEIFSFERQSDLPLTIAMLIDISGSQDLTLPYEKAAGQRFFSKMLRPKKDLGAVVSFEHESVLVQSLTGDVERLNQALDSVQINVQASVATIGGTPPISTSSAGATAMYDAIYSVSADLLSREAGRRVIILLTDGHDTYSQLKMKDAIERAWRNEIIVYAIGIGSRTFGINQGALKKITAETGGRAFFPRKEADLDQAFALIDEDLRSQYVLAYPPTNDEQDGSFRTIQLRVKGRKDLTVRHRRGYFAPKV